MWAAATGKARLPVVASLTGGTTRRLVPAERILKWISVVHTLASPGDPCARGIQIVPTPTAIEVHARNVPVRTSPTCREFFPYIIDDLEAASGGSERYRSVAFVASLAAWSDRVTLMARLEVAESAGCRDASRSLRGVKRERELLLMALYPASTISVEERSSQQHLQYPTSCKTAPSAVQYTTVSV